MSNTKVYVGNLSYETTEDDLKELFSQHGAMSEVKLIIDRSTDRSKGFAFITFEDEQSAQSALALNDTEFQSRSIKVNIARERESGGGSSSGGYGGNQRASGGNSW